MEHEAASVAPEVDMLNLSGAGARWDEAEVEAVLVEPYIYVTQVAGKEVRTLLIMAFNHWLQVADDKLEIVKETTKMLHNASLLIDDIQDNSKLRRGQPVAHSVYGIATTINTANYLYFQCMEKVMTMGDPKAAVAFTEQLLELHRGQGMDIYWRDSGICPSEQQYREMVNRKTGGLFGLAVRLMQLNSVNQTDYSRLLELLGLHFQIRDDYANLKSDAYAANKSFAEDLTEGKYSFPILHSIHTAGPRNHQLSNVLRQRTEDLDLKKFCCECIEKTGSFAYTREVLRRLENDVLAEIESLGGNSMLVKLVEKLGGLYAEPDAVIRPEPEPSS